MQFYELKQYKKGLKAAESILAVYPNHGQTMCMKGLTLFYVHKDKRDEAYALVKAGLKFGLRSHVCWHVYGLLYRGDHNYVEAIKCYNCALRLDPSNTQIEKDTALLQIHVRDLAGYTVLRRKMLHDKSNVRNNWVSYAMALHLQKDYAQAIKVLDAYEDVRERASKANYEDQELHLYKNLLLSDSGDFAGALSHLDGVEAEMLDKLAWRTKRAELLTRMGT